VKRGRREEGRRGGEGGTAGGSGRVVRKDRARGERGGERKVGDEGEGRTRLEHRPLSKFGCLVCSGLG